MTREECINQASKYIKDTAYDNPNQFTKWYWNDTKAHAWCGVFIDYVIKHDLKCNWLDSCSNLYFLQQFLTHWKFVYLLYQRVNSCLGFQDTN